MLVSSSVIILTDAVALPLMAPSRIELSQRVLLGDRQPQESNDLAGPGDITEAPRRILRSASATTTEPPSDFGSGPVSRGGVERPRRRQLCGIEAPLSSLKLRQGLAQRAKIRLR